MSPPTTFQFRTCFEPVIPSRPLWQIRLERPSEFQLIVRALEEASSDQSQQLLRKIIDSSGDVGCSDVSALSASAFLDQCEKRNLSLEWLINVCLGEKVSLSCDSRLMGTMCSLISGYEPLQIQKDLSAEHEAELGSNFRLSVQASGSPQPTYHWFFLAADASEWKLLDVETANMLVFERFAAVDCGMYRCHVQHFFDVYDDSGVRKLSGIYSNRIDVSVKPGSIWLSEATTTTAQSKECQLGSPVSLEVSASSAEELSYQWFHDGRRLGGEVGPRLQLQEVTTDMAGNYECEVSNAQRTVRSPKVFLTVTIPSASQLESGEISFSNENIKMVLQPAYSEKDNRKCAVGDKISLKCLAVCRYPVKYEWVKQGISKDLTGHPCKKHSVSGITRLGTSSQIHDEIVDGPTLASHWVYQCIVTCPHTGESLSSNPVMVPVSTFLSPEKRNPAFKIALVICQEEYDDQAAFVKLNAPKKDGKALIRKLKEMDFEVLSFVNLTVEEFRNCLDLFCALVDESTFVLFYFNGHALNSKQQHGLLMAGTDSRMTSSAPLEQRFVSQQEIEACIDSRRPLLEVFIYDSCRKEAPAEVISSMVNGSSDQQHSLRSSYIRGYGTRQAMENFEVSFRQGSHGIYMKHLLAQIDSRESVGTVFEMLTESFTRSEDQSLVRNMTPEFENGTKQRMSLSAPLRSSRCGRLAQLHFNLCRYEALVPLHEEAGFSSSQTLKLGVAVLTDQVPEWNNAKYDGKLSIKLLPTMYDNEALLAVTFGWTDGRTAEDLSFQVIGVNVQLSYKYPELPMEGHAVVARFLPCAKKPSDGFEPKDGPIFGVNERGGGLSGRCLVTNLQQTADSIKMRVIMRSRRGRTMSMCKGVCVFRAPIIENFPGLKMNNMVYKHLYEHKEALCNDLEQGRN